MLICKFTKGFITYDAAQEIPWPRIFDLADLALKLSKEEHAMLERERDKYKKR